MPNLSKFPEWRILGILGIIVLSAHLLSLFGSVLAVFSDIFLLLFLSWLLASILEPLVTRLSRNGLSWAASALVIYSGLTLLALALIMLVLPATVSQLSQLLLTLPQILPENSFLSPRLEAFLTTALTSSASFASSLASALARLTMVLILSFYLLTSKKAISQFILNLIPDNYEEDYRFLESVLNDTFASFLRVQITLGLVLGAIVLLTLMILRVNFSLTTALFSALLAMIPVLGPILFLLPVILATIAISPQTALVTTAIILLASQLVFNVLSPKLLGSALQIHPIIVILSFLVGYRVAGLWGAIFAVPVAAALAILGKELLKYWHQEADK